MIKKGRMVATSRKTTKKPKLGSGKRFSALKSSLAAKGATDPGALAASIGRKAHGKRTMARLASAGKRRVNKKGK